MKKQIFKTGDRIFYYTKGWGKVIKAYNKLNSPKSMYVLVDFDDKTEGVIYFTNRQARLLSFTEYTLQGASQKRPVNYNKQIGKLGVLRQWIKSFVNKLKF